MRERAAIVLACALCGTGRGGEPFVAATGASQAGSPIEHPEAEGRSETTVALSWQGSVRCSGTILGPDVVLTAAHCLHRAPPDAVLRTDGSSFVVARAVVHPDFDLQTLSHDLAVLRLAERASPPYAQRASSDSLPLDTLLIVAGTAAPSNQPGWGNFLGSARVTEVDERRLTLAPAPSTPCGGDSGGSVFLAEDPPRSLVAVISAGDADCTKVSYATRLDGESEFLDDACASGASSKGCALANERTPGGLVLAWVLAASMGALVARRRHRSRLHDRRASRRRGTP